MSPNAGGSGREGEEHELEAGGSASSMGTQVKNGKSEKGTLGKRKERGQQTKGEI